MSTTLEQLRALVVQHLGLEARQLDDALPFAELGLDSLTLVDFMFAVEDHYLINIDHDQAMAEPTLQGLARLVDQLRAAKTAAPA